MIIPEVCPLYILNVTSKFPLKKFIVNMVEILCTHVYKWKNETCWDYSRNGGRRIRENDGGGESNYDVL
jgi:hypothetical protein